MGKSLLWVIAVCACANNVPQDRSTGPDGTIKGAKEIALEEGTGKQQGIVTYPGGDRIDWKKITLPEKATGKLELTMSYTTPRPDLKATFDVFDQWKHPLKETASGKGRNKSLSISKAQGTYFVRVYAPRRTDAAKYVLQASFTPDPAPFEGGPIAVNDPPTLPAVPEADPNCVVAYDKSNPACETTCALGSPKNHKGCAKPADPSTPPVVPPVPPDPGTKEPPPPTKPVVARIMNKEVQSDGSIVVVLGAGSDTGVGKEWTKGSLLKGDGKDLKARFPNGSITVIQVDRRTTKVRLRPGITSDILQQNDKVVLEP